MIAPFESFELQFVDGFNMAGTKLSKPLGYAKCRKYGLLRAN
ncbi:hypothetical protein CES85_0560 [Ochrobactrum quorumnocens]|uniref:Uncharacterized protein n=1 Tax=Ochrobactrum quorumnocens TaxID=271865 RepID=A0A248UI32_9HYPH|nr:hypothetical protein CES85_0560 [[Ochrobactrum] quorumnocens]